HGRIPLVQTLHPATRSLRLDGCAESTLCGRPANKLGSFIRSAGRRLAIVEGVAFGLWVVVSRAGEKIAAVVAEKVEAGRTNNPQAQKAQPHPPVGLARMVCRDVAEG